MTTHSPTVAVHYPQDGNNNVASYIGWRVASKQYVNALAKYYSGILIIIGASDPEFRSTYCAKDNIVFAIDISDATAFGFDVLFCLDPYIGNAAWRRLSSPGRPYLIVGLTHSISPVPTFRHLQALTTMPIGPFDSILATSTAAEQSINRILGNYSDRPTVSLIPLGIEIPDSHAKIQKYSFREEFDLPHDAFILAYIGRLTFAEKFYPHALFKATRLAQNRVKRQIALLICGTFPNEFMRQGFNNIRDNFHDIDIRIIEHPSDLEKDKLLYASDCFAFPIDNYQETFGLVILEAMSHRLPVIASKFGGVKDIVVDGVTGVMINSICMLSGDNNIVAQSVLGQLDSREITAILAQRVAIDVEHFSDTIVALSTDPTAVCRLGEAGYLRVKDKFSWTSVISRLEYHLHQQTILLNSDSDRMQELWSRKFSIHHNLRSFGDRCIDKGSIFRMEISEYNRRLIDNIFFDWRHIPRGVIEQIDKTITDLYSKYDRYSLDDITKTASEGLKADVIDTYVREFVIALVKIGVMHVDAKSVYYGDDVFVFDKSFC